ncbi:hypothetical protein OC846_002065 [Tilletia horrida]|uniref:Uncharacterized protein n=1 Tax=Tilletia horrida TaxID=155126 RepID=A0AAN6GT25_9BASI|nr:hypothetical protein OC846_002065 [Tilletia horrida]KAK0568277.1 hypothetical protein OC861_002141 [Tilletia horrida]
MAGTPFSAEHKRPHIWANVLPRTVDECDVILASGQIREKEGWRTKVFNEDIMAKWKDEAIKQQNFTETMAEYLEDELKYEAKQWHNEELGIERTGVPYVVRSDRLVPAALLEQLKKLSSELEDIPDEKKDWHPETDETVLDVVHPSLYCLVDDHTRVLSEEQAVTFPDDSRDLGRWFQTLAKICEGVKEKQDDPREDLRGSVTHTCQWLPTDFQVDEAGKVKALSYINQLHPDPKTTSGKMYGIIENLLSAFVPLFEATLLEYQGAGFRKEFRKGASDAYWIEESWDPDAPEQLSVEQLASTEEDKQYLLSDGTSPWEKSINRIESARREHWLETRKWVRIPVKAFEPEKIEPADLSLKNRKLQIIVKMATIHLTPSKPEYEGGAWHVEGTHREKICATGIYYFDQDNIGDSQLNFRGKIDVMEAETTIPYEQFEHDSASMIKITEIYGFGEDTESSQELGSVKTKQGRAIAFPNGVQHQVQPFKLADPTKPGYRKIIAFFLVDPVQTVISTGRVPPQNHEWMQKYYVEVMNSFPEHIPVEVRHMMATKAAPAAIVPRPVQRNNGPDAPQKRARVDLEKDLSCGMTLEEARAYRMELMRERAAQTVHIEEENEQGFSFCEH